MRLKYKRLSLTLCLVMLLTPPALSGVEFDQLNDYVTITDHADFDFPRPFTILAWINPDDWGDSSNGRILDHGGGAGADGWAILVNDTNDTLTFYENGGSGAGAVHGSVNAITLNVWQHVAISVGSGGAYQFYVDGATAGNGSGLIDPAADTDDLLIGARDTDKNREFDGTIAGVMLFSTDLSQAEVQSLMRNPFSVSANLLAHWPLYGKDSTEVDLGPGGHNGTITGATDGNDNPPIGPMISAYSGFTAAPVSAVRRRQNVLIGQ